ncbi:phage replisome organizer N-terminal domain-containing protein [Chloroflexota bacterium]
MTSRTWIKVYCEKWLSGTIREEQANVRSVWIDLLTLAGSGQFGDIGEIKLSNGIGLTDAQIAEILHISKALWRKSKQRFLLSQRITIAPKGAISIVNWSKYQSDYQRQKPYRTSKSNENQS